MIKKSVSINIKIVKIKIRFMIISLKIAGVESRVDILVRNNLKPGITAWNICQSHLLWASGHQPTIDCNRHQTLWILILDESKSWERWIERAGAAVAETWADHVALPAALLGAGCTRDLSLVQHCSHMSCMHACMCEQITGAALFNIGMHGLCLVCLH